jgi:hypothetical protein
MTSNSAPSTLDSATLVRRLHDLAGDERRVQVDFLLHLDELDRRRAYLIAGFGSLWDFCLKALHLREGAAGRRIGAMRVLRRHPRLEPALRSGKLCLSTAALLGSVLTDENLDELVERAAFRTKTDVDHLVASIQPRVGPANGVRKLPAVPGALNGDTAANFAGTLPMTAVVETAQTPGTSQPFAAVIDFMAAHPQAACAAPPVGASAEAHPIDAAAFVTGSDAPAMVPPLSGAPPRAAEVRAVSRDAWSLRVTIDAGCKADLETLAALLSHKAGRDLGAVLREALRCGIEKHGKRRGAVTPARPRPRASARRDDSSPADARAIPAAVRREVWARDSGCCTWSGDDGRRCGSTWKLELDHVVAVARGGASEPDNLRLLCRAHNVLHAERTYGREQMERYSRARGDAAFPNATRLRPAATAELLEEAMSCAPVG